MGEEKIEMTNAVAMLRQMAENETCCAAVFQGCGDEEAASYSEAAAAAMEAGAEALNACQWRPVEELTPEDRSNPQLIIFGILHDDGIMDTSDTVRSLVSGYTHFFRLPKLAVPHA